MTSFDPGARAGRILGLMKEGYREATEELLSLESLFSRILATALAGSLAVSQGMAVIQLGPPSTSLCKFLCDETAILRILLFLSVHGGGNLARGVNLLHRQFTSLGCFNSLKRQLERLRVVFYSIRSFLPSAALPAERSPSNGMFRARLLVQMNPS